MTYRLTGKWLIVGSLAGAFVMASACAGDPPKRAVNAGDGGEGGGGAGEGGARNSATNGGEPNTMAGVPGLAGDAGQGGELNTSTAGAGGVPIDVQPQGGMPAAGVPNEPTAGAPPVLAQCEGTLVFPDPYVDQLVHTAVDNSGPITLDNVLGLTQISIPFNDADVDLTGLECLSGLTSIDLDRGGQNGMEVLANLPNLRTITFANPYSVDFASLGAVTQITSLDVSGVYSNDFNGLDKLTSLQTLNLANVGSGGPIDFTPLGALTKLKSLDLRNVYIADGAPLASLTKLETLSLNNATIPSVTFVAGLTKLRSLDLGRTGITTIPSLAALTQLTTLDISYNTLSSFTPLAAHTILTSLNVASTTLSNLTSIAPLNGLVTLNVSYNALTDVTALGALPALTSLNLAYNNGVTSVHPLATSAYIGAGDSIDVSAVGDCSAPFTTDFQAIKDKGVTITNGCGI